MKIFDHGIEVKSFELPGVVKRLAHGVGLGAVPVQDLQVQLIGPPVCVGGGAG
jgi:hypothetical protein